MEKSACCKYIEPNASHYVTAIEIVLALLQQGCFDLYLIFFFSFVCKYL